jgi:hypothetical protein
VPSGGVLVTGSYVLSGRVFELGSYLSFFLWLVVGSYVPLS